MHSNSVMLQHGERSVKVRLRDQPSRELEARVLFEDRQGEQEGGSELGAPRGIQREPSAVEGSADLDWETRTSYMVASRAEAPQSLEQLLDGSFGEPLRTGQHDPPAVERG
jgi:hypothetical protein